MVAGLRWPPTPLMVKFSRCLPLKCLLPWFSSSPSWPTQFRAGSPYPLLFSQLSFCRIPGIVWSWQADDSLSFCSF